jgi:hypothetical protein
VGQWPPKVCNYYNITTRGVARAHTGDRRKPFKRQLRLRSGPWPLFDFSRFSNTHTLKPEMVTFLMSIFLQILHIDCLKHKEQFFFLDQLQNPKESQVINSGINSNLNLP